MPLHPEIARILATLPHEDGPLDPAAMRAAEDAWIAAGFPADAESLQAIVKRFS